MDGFRKMLIISLTESDKVELNWFKLQIIWTLSKTCYIAQTTQTNPRFRGMYNDGKYHADIQINPWQSNTVRLQGRERLDPLMDFSQKQQSSKIIPSHYFQ